MALWLHRVVPIALALAVGPRPAAAAPTEPVERTAEGEAGERERRTSRRRRRPFMIGLAGVGLQVPALQTEVVNLDPRFVGDTVALGGVGLFARYRPLPLVAFELDTRSGSIRYRSSDKQDLIAQDLVLFEAGTLLYLARGDVGQLALDAGLGGGYNRVAYEIGDTPRSTQRYGSFLVRAGVDAEFLLKRIAIVLSLRSYGVVTNRNRARNSGELLTGASPRNRRAPVPTFQTYISASAGLAYRF